MDINPEWERELHERFMRAAGIAAMLEMDLRLLASLTPSAQTAALSRNVEVVEAAVLKAFDAHVTADDAALLSAARRLRNKILHGEFDVARDHGRGLGMDLGPVYVAEHDPQTGQSGMITDRPIHEVLLGWFVEAAMPGSLFDQAHDTFVGARSILRRLEDIRFHGHVA